MKVIFKYSKIYEMALEAVEDKKELKDPDNFPRYSAIADGYEKEINSFIGEVKRKWEEKKNPILKSFSKASGFKWNLKEQTCYVVKTLQINAISDPMTLKCQKDTNLAVGMILHELLHLLIYKNIPEDSEIYKLGMKLFREEGEVFRSHLLPAVLFKCVKEDLKSEYFDELYEKNRVPMAGCLEYVEKLPKISGNAIDWTVKRLRK